MAEESKTGYRIENYVCGSIMIKIYRQSGCANFGNRGWVRFGQNRQRTKEQYRTSRVKVVASVKSGCDGKIAGWCTSIKIR